jgi:hypothetical protein
MVIKYLQSLLGNFRAFSTSRTNTKMCIGLITLALCEALLLLKRDRPLIQGLCVGNRDLLGRIVELR